MSLGIDNEEVVKVGMHFYFDCSPRYLLVDFNSKREAAKGAHSGLEDGTTIESIKRFNVHSL